jgi:hypothetical protein
MAALMELDAKDVEEVRDGFCDRIDEMIDLAKKIVDSRQGKVTTEDILSDLLDVLEGRKKPKDILSEKNKFSQIIRKQSLSISPKMSITSSGESEKRLLSWFSSQNENEMFSRIILESSVQESALWNNLGMCFGLSRRIDKRIEILTFQNNEKHDLFGKVLREYLEPNSYMKENIYPISFTCPEESKKIPNIPLLINII